MAAVDVAVILTLLDRFSGPARNVAASLQSLTKSLGIINKEAAAASRGLASFAVASDRLTKSAAASGVAMQRIGVSAGGALRSLTGLGGGIKTLSSSAAGLRGAFGGAFASMDSGAASAAVSARALATAWKSVAVAAGQAARAGRAVGRAGAVAAGAGAMTAAGTAAAGTAGRRGVARGGYGGNLYGVVSPGGVHMGYHPSSNAALIAGGAVAYGIYKQAQLQDYSFQMAYHAGVAYTEENKKKFRDIIQTTASQTGFSYHEVGEAGTDLIRLLKGTPGRGLEILPEMLRSAATESRVKGTPLKESMEALVQMAHMTKEYDPEQIKKFAPVFSFLSTTNPATPLQMVRAASYAMPTLQSALHMDPADVMYATTAIARAGAINTKSGTWVRAAFERALPPDPNVTGDKEYERRIYAMRQLGLVDRHNKSTVLDPTGDHLDRQKLLKTVQEHAAALSIAERNAIVKKVFGEQGSRGIFLLMSPQVMEQEEALKKEFPYFANQFRTFFADYSEHSPVQKTREAWEDVTNVLADIGGVALPALLPGLHAFDAILKSITTALPSITPNKEDSFGAGLNKALGRGMAEGSIPGAALGAGIGFFAGGVGAIPGAAWGAGLGALGGGAIEGGRYIYNYLGSPALGLVGRAHAAESNSLLDSIGFGTRNKNALNPTNPGLLGFGSLGAGSFPEFHINLENGTPKGQTWAEEILSAIRSALSGVTVQGPNIAVPNIPGYNTEGVVPQSYRPSAPSGPAERRADAGARNVHVGSIVVQGTRDPHSTAHMVKLAISDMLSDGYGIDPAFG